MIQDFIRAMKEGGLEMTGRELAEALYLARFLKPPDPPKKIETVSAGIESEPPRLQEATERKSDDTEPKPQREQPSEKPPPKGRKGDLYIPGLSRREDFDGIDVLPIRIPAAIALPGAQEISRALRPLLRRHPSRTRQEIDIERTVQMIAETGIKSVIRKPVGERWLDLALVVDESRSMKVWEPTVREFKRLLERHGAFRDVRGWSIDAGSSEIKYPFGRLTAWKPRVDDFRQLILKRDAFRSANTWANEKNLGKACNWKVKIDRVGFFHGCSMAGTSVRQADSTEIRDPNGRRLIMVLTDCISTGWRNQEAFRLVTKWGEGAPVVLIQVLPQHKWIGTALPRDFARFKSRQPGLPNSRLILEDGRKPVEGIPLPLIKLEEWAVGPWARMTAARGHATAAGVLISPPGQLEGQGDRKRKKRSITASPSQDVEPTPAERIARFRANASDNAFQLACYLAVVELTMPIMRMVQQAMLPGSRQIHLAEVYLGGLLFRHPQNIKSVINPDEVVYDFYPGETDQDPGIRDLLLEITPRSHIERVRDEISMLIEGRIARPDEISALVALPGVQTGRQVDSVRKPFSWISQAALKRLGYQPGPPPLPIFEFDTITLDEYGKEINREKGEARYFREELSDKVHLDMVQNPGGSYLMGTSEDEIKDVKKEIKRYAGNEDLANREIPQHEVEISPYFIGKYAVTQAQWREVAGWEKVDIDLNPDPSKFKGDNRPVENISWDEAKEFCRRLAKKTGRDYRLPTEAEWEYACRAGTDTPFAFGETITPDYVNYQGEYPYAKASKGKYRGETIDVGSLAVANGWGLYDMHGNVWEWCEDLWHNNYDGAPRDGSAWLSGDDSSRRVVRGGSYGNDARICRSAYRLIYGPDLRNLNQGFRVVCVSARTNGA